MSDPWNDSFDDRQSGGIDSFSDFHDDGINNNNRIASDDIAYSTIQHDSEVVNGPRTIEDVVSIIDLHRDSTSTINESMHYPINHNMVPEDPQSPFNDTTTLNERLTSSFQEPFELARMNLASRDRNDTVDSKEVERRELQYITSLSPGDDLIRTENNFTNDVSQIQIATSTKSIRAMTCSSEELYAVATPSEEEVHWDSNPIDDQSVVGNSHLEEYGSALRMSESSIGESDRASDGFNNNNYYSQIPPFTTNIVDDATRNSVPISETVEPRFYQESDARNYAADLNGLHSEFHDSPLQVSTVSQFSTVASEDGSYNRLYYHPAQADEISKSPEISDKNPSAGNSYRGEDTGTKISDNHSSTFINTTSQSIRAMTVSEELYAVATPSEEEVHWDSNENPALLMIRSESTASIFNEAHFPVMPDINGFHELAQSAIHQPEVISFHESLNPENITSPDFDSRVAFNDTTSNQPSSTFADNRSDYYVSGKSNEVQGQGVFLYSRSDVVSEASQISSWNNIQEQSSGNGAEHGKLSLHSLEIDNMHQHHSNMSDVSSIRSPTVVSTEVSPIRPMIELSSGPETDWIVVDEYDRGQIQIDGRFSSVVQDNTLSVNDSTCSVNTLTSVESREDLFAAAMANDRFLKETGQSALLSLPHGDDSGGYFIGDSDDQSLGSRNSYFHVSPVQESSISHFENIIQTEIQSEFADNSMQRDTSFCIHDENFVSDEYSKSAALNMLGAESLGSMVIEDAVIIGGELYVQQKSSPNLTSLASANQSIITASPILIGIAPVCDEPKLIGDVTPTAAGDFSAAPPQLPLMIGSSSLLNQQQQLSNESDSLQSISDRSQAYVSLLPNDIAVIAALSQWLTTEAGIVPTRANRYADSMISDGIGTVKRAAKKIARDENYFKRVLGFDEDDAEEIVIALKRLGLIAPVESDTVSSGGISVIAGDVSGNSVTDTSCSVTSVSLEVIKASSEIGVPPPVKTFSNGGDDIPIGSSVAMSLFPFINSLELEKPVTNTSSPSNQIPTNLSLMLTPLDIPEQSLVSPPVIVTAVPVEKREKSFKARLHATPKSVPKTPTAAATAPVLTQDQIEEIKRIYKLSEQEMNALTGGINANSVSQAMASVTNALNMLRTVDTAANAQTLLGRVGYCTAVITALNTFIGDMAFVEKSLQVITLLSRRGLDQKTASLPNLKSFGTGGAPQIIVTILQRYCADSTVCTWVFSAVRSLVTLDSNKSRLGACGICELIIQVLLRHPMNEEVSKYAFRAIGHLSNEHPENRTRFGNVGACEQILMYMQRYLNSVPITGEGCWALRNLAVDKSLLERLILGNVCEMMCNVIFRHADTEIVLIEALRVVCVICGESKDDQTKPITKPLASSAPANNGTHISVAVSPINSPLSPSTPSPGNKWKKAFTIVSCSVHIHQGLLRSLSRAVPRNMNVPNVMIWVCHAIIVVSSSVDIKRKFIDAKYCETVIELLQNQSDNAALAEWCCKVIFHFNSIEGIAFKFRSLGGCELVVTAMKKHAKYPQVMQASAMAISTLAVDSSIRERLGTAEACETVVVGLNRYWSHATVASRALEAIHFLALEPNNRAWLGAAGACELSVRSLRAHAETSADVCTMGCRAIGSLSTSHENNTERLRLSKGCECVIIAMTTHPNSERLAEYGARAVYHLCHTSNLAIQHIGVVQGCEAVVAAMQKHKNSEPVAHQACKAIAALIGNSEGKNGRALSRDHTAKLVAAGAIQSIVLALTQHSKSEATCVSAIKAISQLVYGAEPNRSNLGNMGVCALIIQSLRQHINSDRMISASAVAIERLTKKHDENKKRCGDAGCCEVMVNALQTRGTEEEVVVSIFRALVSLFYYLHNRRRIARQDYCTIIVKTMRRNKLSLQAVRWGTTAITTLIYDDFSATLLGQCKAAEAVVKSISNHTKDAEICEWGCMALWKLATIEANKFAMSNSEACELLVNILKIHKSNSKVVDWCTKIIVQLAGYFPSVQLISGRAVGSGGFGHSSGNVPNNIVQGSPLDTEDVYSPLSTGAGSAEQKNVLNGRKKGHRRTGSGTPMRSGSGSGTPGDKSSSLFDYSVLQSPTASVANASANAISNASNALSAAATVAFEPNRNKFLTAGIAEPLILAMKSHPQVEPIIRMGCEIIFHLCLGDEVNGITALGLAGACDVVVSALEKFALSNEELEFQGVRAMAALSNSSQPSEIPNIFFLSGACISLSLLLKKYTSNPLMVQWTCMAAQLLCQKCPECREAFASTSICETLADGLIVKYKTYGTALLPMLKLIHSLASGSIENRRKFVSSGIIDSIVSASVLYRTSVPDRAIIDNACWCIGNLHTASSNELRTGQEGILIAMAALLRPDIKAKVAKNALDALLVLANYPGSAPRIGTMRACESVLSMLSKFIQDEGIVESALLNICALCRDCFVNRDSFHAGGIYSSIMKILGRHGNPHAIISAAIRACTDLSIGHGGNQNDFGSIPSLRIIFRAAAAAQVTSGVVAANMCSFVGYFSNSNAAFQVRLAGTGYMNLVVDCIRAHRKDISVCREGMWALCSVAHRNIENKIKLGQIGGCEVVMSTFKQFGQSVPLVALWCCGACANLCANSSDNAARLGALDACEEIMLTLGLYTNNVISASAKSRSGGATNLQGVDFDVIKYSCWAIANLCQLIPLCSRLGAQGACEKFVEILSTFFNESEALTQLICAALSALCQTSENRDRLLALGLSDLLISVESKYTGRETLLKVVGNTRNRLTGSGPDLFVWDGGSTVLQSAVQGSQTAITGTPETLKRPESMGRDRRPSINETLSNLFGTTTTSGASVPIIISATSTTAAASIDKKSAKRVVTAPAPPASRSAINNSGSSPGAVIGSPASSKVSGGVGGAANKSSNPNIGTGGIGNIPAPARSSNTATSKFSLGGLAKIGGNMFKKLAAGAMSGDNSSYSNDSK